jgi:hypothetical protein
MQQVLGAVRTMLATHEPLPAVAIDRAWNVRLANRAFDAMIALLGDEVWARVGGGAPNLMRLLFHPQGARPLIANWTAIAPVLWHRARREAETLGGQEMQALLDELARHHDDDTLWPADDATLLPVVPLELRVGEQRLSLFTVIATFGTPQDVTADELRIETFFPADAATEQLFRGVRTWAS